MMLPRISAAAGSASRIRNAQWCATRKISFLKKLLSLDSSEVEESERPVYYWDESPYADIRTRAAFIRAKAKCPVTHKSVNYVCPHSGIPTHHDQEAYEKDTEYHAKKKYELLKKVNLYEHDLRSGRKFNEFVFPGPMEHDFATSVGSWDSFFYTRDFNPMNTEFNLAAATKVLTYPITIASLMHQYSPYQMEPKGPVTLEGIRSSAALKYSLYSTAQSKDSEVNFKDRPMRIFIVGAKMEAMLPGYVWKQFGYLFPDTKFEIHLIGPHSHFDADAKNFTPSDRPYGRPIVTGYDEQIVIHHHTKYFHEVYDTGDLFPFDPYLDCFFLFHPGFRTADEIHWDKSLKGLLESKCAVYVTGYHGKDLERELTWLESHPLYEETDILMRPTENIFGSTKLDLVDANPTETFQANHDMFAFRGKRYHAIRV